LFNDEQVQVPALDDLEIFLSTILDKGEDFGIKKVKFIEKENNINIYSFSILCKTELKYKIISDLINYQKVNSIVKEIRIEDLFI
ncbi:MAG: hypothetical protein MJ252_11445, partial [archaeon]|nr:hypothetical protein [archaeon]